MKSRTILASAIVIGTASIGAITGEVISQHAAESYRNSFPRASSLDMQPVVNVLKEAGSTYMEFMGVLGGFVLGAAEGINTVQRIRMIEAKNSYNTGNYSD